MNERETSTPSSGLAPYPSITSGLAASRKTCRNCNYIRDQRHLIGINIMEAQRSSLGPYLPFLHTIEKLKNLPRAGWVKRGIHSPESVSDHSYRMVVLCFMLEVCFKSYQQFQYRTNALVVD